MEVQEVIGRAIAHGINSESDLVILALSETLLYHHTENLEDDIPLERVESDLIEFFEGDLPEELDLWLDSLDDEWNPDESEHILQDL